MEQPDAHRAKCSQSQRLVQQNTGRKKTDWHLIQNNCKCDANFVVDVGVMLWLIHSNNLPNMVYAVNQMEPFSALIFICFNFKLFYFLNLLI